MQLAGAAGGQDAGIAAGSVTDEEGPDGYSFDLGIEFQYPVLTWGRSEGDIFEW